MWKNDRTCDGLRAAAGQSFPLLHRAGCYSGWLDNQWGPGSRKALDAFVSRTGAKQPGSSPSMALWDALEEAAKQHGEACR